MIFSGLDIKGWRQFSDVSLIFHSRLTIIAGANGAGKSTLLRVLSQNFGLTHNLLATPTISKSGVLSYLYGLFGGIRLGDQSQGQASDSVGSLTYSSGTKATLRVPSTGQVAYNVQIENMQSLQGLFIDSHRPTSGYQQVTSIPTNAINAQQAYQAYHQEVQNKYNNQWSQFSPIYRIKEAIMSMATFGPGNNNVQRNPILEKNYQDFKRILSQILPLSVGFEDVSIRIPDVVLVTKSGEFVIDAASGGLMALIDLAWQVFLFSRDKDEFVAIIDEPENHLHPSMQRTVIGSLLDAFPGAQFIVATHSPFVVSSVKDSSVYVLRYKEDKEGKRSQRRVFSEKLDNVNKAGAASEILRSVLGVPITLPLWAEDELREISANFSMNTLDGDRINELRYRLERAGLGEYYPEALGQIAAQQ